MGNCNSDKLESHRDIRIISVNDFLIKRTEETLETESNLNSNFTRGLTMITSYYPLKHTPMTRIVMNKEKSREELLTQPKTFKIIYKNKNTYEGEIHRSSELPHGQGIFTCSEGDSYEGRFRNGQASGKGVYTHSNGIIYEGTLFEGKKNGFGEEKYPNGEIYKGYFKEDRKHGRGCYTFKDGSFYDGEISYNMKHGKGILKCVDGEKYTGEWVSGVRHGRGRIRYPNQEVFEGEFSNNLREGLGVLRKGDNIIYEGKFVNDIRIDQQPDPFISDTPITKNTEEQRKGKDFYFGYTDD